MNASVIGLSSLDVGRRGLDLVGQNIANASTPGYHRQRLELVSRTTGVGEGAGVDVQRVSRAEAPSLRKAILAGNSDLASFTTQLSGRQQVETVLGTGTDNIATQLDNFFSRAERLSTRPSDLSVRRDVLGAANTLAQQFNSVAGSIDQLQFDRGNELAQQVNEVNRLTSKISDFNGKIYQIEAGGGTANDLKDQRDQLIDDLSKRIDLRTVEQPYGVTNLFGRDTALVVADVSTQLTVIGNTDGSRDVAVSGTTNPIRIEGGSVGGLLQDINTDIPATRSRLDNLAKEFIHKVNQVQSTGIGTNGPLTSSRGILGVPDPATPLAGQQLDYPVQAGSIIISITNIATDTRTNVSVPVDPSTQSLNDIAAAISAATSGQVNATVTSPDNSLQFQAQTGYKFDFAGRVTNPPDNIAIGGTSVPSVSGVYTGNTNTTYNYSISGAGTIGVTPGLTLQVKDSNNNIINTLDVGSGYTPGQSLTVGNGISVKLSAGTTNNGTFSSPAIANSDTADLLSALGVNGLFSGTNAASIKIKPEILADPSKFSASRSGDSGDSANLKKLVQVGDSATIGTRTFSQEFTDLASTVGAEVRSLDDRKSAQTGILQSLSNQEQSEIGVDTNEELVKLLDYQRMVTSASKYISVVNEALDSIVNAVR